MEALFAEQAASHAILTDDLFCDWEAGHDSERKTADIGGFEFNLLYVRSRGLRHDQTLLFKMGIKNPDAARYYEYNPSPDFPYVRYLTEESYQRLAPEVRKHVKASPFLNYLEANPKAKFLAVNLHGRSGAPQKMHISPNLASFCCNHFLVWPEPDGYTGLNQSYHEDMLFWIDDLFCRLDSNYSLFFSAKGAGNSIDTLHFQILPLPFPAFDYLSRYYGNADSILIETDERAWPLPGVFTRYHSGTKDWALADLDRYIRRWLSLDNDHTFNLLFRSMPDEIREFFFIFRKKGIARIAGITNELGASETGGNVVIEAWEEFERFPAKTERFELINEAEQPAYREGEKNL
jgi:hypothetical protein